MSVLASSLPDARDGATGLAGRRPAVFLDYDGVLTPIVARPSDAVITDHMRETVRALAARCPVAVVSGRDRATIYELSGLDDLVVAGSHGFDIHDPATGTVRHDASEGFEDLVAAVVEEVTRRAGGVAGTEVEPKHASVALHYRAVAPAEVPRVQEIVDAVLAAHPGELRVTPGKAVHEIQPAIDWDKGRAVLHLLEVLDLTGPDVVPVYLGDDVTDEDAFRALAGRGLGVLVVDPAEAADRRTAADAVLATVDDVEAFLDGLAR